ncbi:hypothetical protein JXB31_02420 [Candidatus Woesearchaeota archaeon]|nr:hypothetical protein [Candidatus Woesearchaeota archaeon]
MVKYAENWFESLINKLVLISLLVIIAQLVLELGFKIEFTKSYTLISDSIINSIFIIDLVHIYRKKDSVKTFLTQNWLDIIACIPLNSLFRAVKLVRIARVAKIVARQGKATKLLPTATKLKRFSLVHTTKLFSKETEVDMHIDFTKDKIIDLKLSKLDHEMNKIYNIINNYRY